MSMSLFDYVGYFDRVQSHKSSSFYDADDDNYVSWELKRQEKKKKDSV